MTAALNDLELPAYDVVDMAMLMMTLVQDALERAPDGGFIPVSTQQADMLFFASRLMMEKAERVRDTWNALHGAQDDAAVPVRATGGKRS
jgi:hypothetical protein